MKKLLLYIAVLLFVLMSVNSYSLTNFNYKGIALNKLGQILPGTAVNVQITISTTSGGVLYQETHPPVTSDQFGGFVVEVGSGTVVSGAMAGITATADTRIKVETNVGGGAWALSTMESLSDAMDNVLNNITDYAWGLTGNSGTTAGTNFLGTTDDEELRLEVRNGGIVEQSMRMNTNQAIYRESAITGITAGNARGQYAVDMQIIRTAATQVASGHHSTVGGGSGNTASGGISTVGGGVQNTASGYASTVGGGWGNTASVYYTTVGGGNVNKASGEASTVGGGYLNTASGVYSTVGGGFTNTSSASYSTVGGGYINTASDYASTVGGGWENTASASYSTVGGGAQNTANNYVSAVGGGTGNTASGRVSTVGGGTVNTASGDFSTVSGGNHAVADKYGQNAYASGLFANAGDAQTSVFVVRNSTSAAGWTTLYLNGSTENMSMSNSATWTFRILVVGKQTGGTNNGAGYEITGVVTNNGGTATILGTPTVTTLYESNASYNARVTVSGANLVIQVEGNGDALRWVARVETSEVTW